MTSFQAVKNKVNQRGLKLKLWIKDYLFLPFHNILIVIASYNVTNISLGQKSGLELIPVTYSEYKFHIISS